MLIFYEIVIFLKIYEVIEVFAYTFKSELISTF